MEDLKRIKKVVNWLIFREVAENERSLAEVMGYTKSSFSQIMNGKVSLSDKFMKNLCALDENINFVWVKSGEGSMFIKDNLNSEMTVPTDVWDVIKKQSESLAARDRQIDELMGLLKEQIQESKKMLARQDGDATSAAAV